MVTHELIFGIFIQFHHQSGLKKVRGKKQRFVFQLCCTEAQYLFYRGKLQRREKR